MKTWYQNRMESGVKHRGQVIPKDKKLYLSDTHTKQHNAQQEKVFKCEPPKDQKEVGVIADWDEYEKETSPAREDRSLKANPIPDSKDAETTETKVKSSLKAKK